MRTRRRFGVAVLGLAAVALLLGGASTNATAAIIAADNFPVPPYTVGPLNGQPVRGTGFTGNWTQFLASDLAVVSSGVIGRPVVINGQAGDFANFGPAFTVNSGQLFISYNINNPQATNLSSSRLDVNTSITAQSAVLGAIGVQSPFNFQTAFGFGSTAVAQSNIPSVGAHHLVSVLDFTNHDIALFVDPTASSFYNPNGTNNAQATAAWTPPAGAFTFTSYSLVDNLNDTATFGNVQFATLGSDVGVDPAVPGPTTAPEPSSLALLALGGLGLAGWRRWRKRTA